MKKFFSRLLGLEPKKIIRKSVTIKNDHKLHALWVQLHEVWFPDRDDLKNYRVVWSARPQKRTLATCHYRHKKVTVARELHDVEYASWLEPLLYHEMCHAVLGSTLHASGNRSWHGKEFKALERRHPGSKDLNAWMKSGGWAKAVRRDRGKRSWATRRLREEVLDD
jgi:hypothetical protein